MKNLIIVSLLAIGFCFDINHSGINQNQLILDKYTPQGENYSPELSWTDPPLGTKSLALVVEDPDAPKGTWYHWLVYNIDPYQYIIAEDTIPGEQVINSWKINGYKGPSPPKGQKHRYFFRLYALGSKLTKIDNAKDLFKEINKHKLAETYVMGFYEK
jgi:Raf kinase inhibitor-like YbhB/YbcL family protein